MTHLSARDQRTNGTIVGDHVDAGVEYFTVRLDDGREVQTIDDRLRKGEYTGIARWQRMLDATTGCYYFFDEERNETLWDTPEARDRLFSMKRPSPTAVVDDVVSPTRSRKSISPLKNVSFSTEPPSVVHFSTQDETEEEDADEYVQLSPVAQPPFASSSSQPPIRTSFRSADVDSVVSPTKRIPQQQPTLSTFSAPSLPEKPQRHQPVVLSSEGGETRSRSIANSTDLRDALVKTGSAAIAGNLRVLGIPVGEDEYDSRKLADQLCWALAKISHSIEAGDLNLLLKHVMGGPENHALADRLSFTGESERRNNYQPPVQPSRSVYDEDDHVRSASNQLAYYDGPQSSAQLPLRYDNFQTSQPQRQAHQFNDDNYRESQSYHNYLNDQYVANANYDKPRSPPTNYATRSFDYQQHQQETRRLSREGTGTMEMKGNVSPLAEPYLPIRSPSNYERPESNWQASEIRSDRASFGSRMYETSSPEMSPAPMNARFESRVQPLGTTSVSRQDLLGRVNSSISPNTPHGKPITGAVGSSESIKRRSELWASMPPPSRAPPSGPPLYDRYRQQQRPKSEDLRSTSNFDPATSYDSPVKQTSQSFNMRSNNVPSTTTSAYYSARETPATTAATTHSATYLSSGRYYSSPASSNQVPSSGVGRSAGSNSSSWRDYGGDHLALPPLARDTSASSRVPSSKRQQEWEDDTKVRLYLGDDDVNEDDSGSFKQHPEARHSNEGIPDHQVRRDESLRKMNSSMASQQQQQYGSSRSLKGDPEGGSETILLSGEARLQQQQQQSSDVDRQRNSRGEQQNVRQASLRGIDSSKTLTGQENNQIPESSDMIEDAPQSILRTTTSGRSGSPIRMNSDRGMDNNARSSSPVRSGSPLRTAGLQPPRVAGVEIDHDEADEQKDDHVIEDDVHELDDEVRSSNEVDEHDLSKVKGLGADLSDLNMSLDKLLQQVAGAGDRIDATWKPQEEEQVQIDPRPPPKPVKNVPEAPKPSKSCGCTVS